MWLQQVIRVPGSVLPEYIAWYSMMHRTPALDRADREKATEIDRVRGSFRMQTESTGEKKLNKILGISGSPIKNSNTDRLINVMLDATGCEYEFIKLSTILVRPCFGCKQCVSDNICKVNDDFQALAEKVKESKALIIGGYIPYGQIDGFTKAFLERLFSLRHVNNLLKGKLFATVLTGLSPELMISVNRALVADLRDQEHMELVGQLTVRGNMPCITCGAPEDCPMSGVKRRVGPDARRSDFTYVRVEEQPDVMEEAVRMGRLIGERLSIA
jgi:NAD(P)H-dependent FMN reductase